MHNPAKLQNEISLSQASDRDFKLITHYVEKFELDGRDMNAAQFMVAKQQQHLLGFGRIRKHPDCDEYCTLGILEEHRSKGIGQLITKGIVAVATQPLFLVCIIPSYFEPFGFKMISEGIPEPVRAKLAYCTSSLSVPEEYVVMKYLPG